MFKEIGERNNVNYFVVMYDRVGDIFNVFCYFLRERVIRNLLLMKNCDCKIKLNYCKL